MASLIEIRNERLGKVAKLRALSIDPYPAKSKRTHTCASILGNYDSLVGKNVSVTGRLMSWRGHGPLSFGDLEDESGKIQLYIKEDVLQAHNKERQNIGYKELDLIDVADFIMVEGKVVKTKTGQISVEAETIWMLSKSLRPLPEKWEGLKDVETKYRQRYLDLVMNRDLREFFVRKSKFWSLNRQFMESRGFIHMDIPVLEPSTGGADAKPFVTHHDALDQDFFLRISLELYPKRLIGGGYEKIYSIGPVFRNEGIDDEHLQDYMQMEWYWAYADYTDNMKLTKDLFRFIATGLYGTTKFVKGEHTFDLADEWREIDYPTIIKETFNIDIFEVSENDLWDCAKKNDVEILKEDTRNRVIDKLWKQIRKTISGPAFLVNEPKFMSPLAKSKADDPRLTERFHVILAGAELANGYSELNDPVDQFNRFKEQQEARDAGDQESQMMDVDFVEMLEHAMPPVTGYGHSERLFWFLENVSAREGTLFPQMRHKVTDLQKELYGL